MGDGQGRFFTHIASDGTFQYSLKIAFLMDVQTFLFWSIALVSGGCAIMVVVSQNIVRAATWLLFALGGTSGIFFLLGADFVGATQLLVYVGGTLVLVVFGVMLTAQGPFITMKIGPAEWAIAGLVGLLLFGVLSYSIVSLRVTSIATNSPLMDNPESSMSSTVLGSALLGLEDATPQSNLTGLPGNVTPRVRTKVSYLLPFEIVSLHLLVVLLGAAYLARAKRRRQA
jgi:NADH:ubiquinone oxidoreductase subunit 6 (subunit J)